MLKCSFSVDFVLNDVFSDRSVDSVLRCLEWTNSAKKNGQPVRVC